MKPGMAKRWSKLQKKIYELFPEDLNLQLHVTPYRMDSQMGSSNIPRYWMTLNKDIIFDYPAKDLETENYYPYPGSFSREVVVPEVEHANNMTSILSSCLHDYRDLPKDQLLVKNYGVAEPLIDIIRAADRRLGKERLLEWGKEKAPAVQQVLQARFEKVREAIPTV